VSTPTDPRDAELARLREELANAHDTIQSLTGSASWRLTAPLRALKPRARRESAPAPAAAPPEDGEPPVPGPPPEAGTVPAEQYVRIQRAMRDWHETLGGDELYYLEFIWDWTRSRLEAHQADLSARFLDGGCGPGRFLIPLAEHVAPHGGHVTAVDLLQEQIDVAAERVRERGLENVDLHASDLHAFLERQEDAAYAGAIVYGVTISLPRLKDTLAQLHRVVRPGGLLLTDFRPRHYLLLFAVARRQWDLAERALAGSSGELPSLGFQNWVTAEQGAAMLRGAGFERVELHGLGGCSGIPGDPLDRLARPAELSEADRASLRRVEEAVASSHPDVGRYVMAAAVRP
jgi:ubiquinone/menaquinone biosynthesis C-methylase UbiE